MKDVLIKIYRNSRKVELSKFVVGNDKENRQGNFVVSFLDEFVNGQARLEYEINKEKKYVILDKENESYKYPITSIFTKNGEVKMQIVITEGTDEENVAIFKSNIFSIYFDGSINAEVEQPDDTASWLEKADSKLNQMDNIDINATQTSNGTNINITDKQGNTSSTEVPNGISCYHKWVGTTLTITSASGTSSANLKGDKGDKGEAGKTPVRGVDYFTQSDINYMINEVLAQIPTSEGVEY